MRGLRSIVSCVALLIALVPVAAFADNSKSHRQAEVSNAVAQLDLAQQQATEFANEGALSAANEREIALLKSEVLRQMQLDNSANGAALQQLASQLAAAIRSSGDANAANELAILQIKANAVITKADAKLANAIAIGRADEIANAQAQSNAAHQLADFLTGTQAQQNMSNAEVIAEDAASGVEASAMVEAQNDDALGANDLFAADTVLNAAQLAATSSEITGETRGESLLAHAEASLANAEAMDAEAD